MRTIHHEGVSDLGVYIVETLDGPEFMFREPQRNRVRDTTYPATDPVPMIAPSRASRDRDSA